MQGCTQLGLQLHLHPVPEAELSWANLREPDSPSFSGDFSLDSHSACDLQRKQSRGQGREKDIRQSCATQESSGS